jgi:hypothetical protein
MSTSEPLHPATTEHLQDEQEVDNSATLRERPVTQGLSALVRATDL